jgi:P27 family predicted phage terminase small subunit
MNLYVGVRHANIYSLYLRTARRPVYVSAGTFRFGKFEGYMKTKPDNEQFKALSDEAKKLFRTIQKEWTIGEEPGITILLTACQSLDRMREAQKILADEGALVKDRFGASKLHPATQLEKEARAHLLQALKALNLDLESLEGA